MLHNKTLEDKENAEEFRKKYFQLSKLPSAQVYLEIAGFYEELYGIAPEQFQDGLKDTYDTLYRIYMELGETEKAEEYRKKAEAL